MKFKRGQLVYNAHTGNKLYTVIGYNGAGGIILEDENEKRVVFGFDNGIYAKRSNDMNLGMLLLAGIIYILFVLGLWKIHK